VKEVAFIASITSAAEMKKSQARRTSKNIEFAFSLDEPFDTLKAQILAKVSSVLNPKTIDFNNYDVSFYIPRILPKPGLSLTNETDFGVLLKRMQKLTGKDPTINLGVVEKEGAVPENRQANANEAAESAMGKSKKQSEAILPGNEKKIQFVKALCEHWICKKPDSACPSPHCYVIPATEDHLPLNPERFDCWASALLKNDIAVATMEKPPHNKLFDEQKKATLSPVLQRRLDLQAAKSAPPLAPVFNFTIGNELLGLICPPQQQATAAVAAQPQITSDLGDRLLPSTRTPGDDISLSQFCMIYDLSQDILTKFQEHAFNHARLLRFVTIPELKEMNFCLGEIAALRDAAEKWSSTL
ncbi:hypothetical protein BDN67DRAFT_902673, partial [Paxillus ammoniavirescens]